MKQLIKSGCFFIFLIPLFGIGQDPVSLPNVIPSSPEVASILRYSEVPVSYFNGIPNIGIPICTLEGRELSVPVSLSYHAGGHRVNEEASWVGLGWNLSAGGQITRVMRGIPDDHSTNGFINTPYTVEAVNYACTNGTTIGDKNCVDLTNIAISNNTIDYEPDDFSYSMLGQSGRFMFNQNRSNDNPRGEIVQFTGNSMKIEPIYAGTGINAWRITDTSGVIYYFSQGDRFLQSLSGSVENYQATIPQGTGTSPQQYAYIESWNLTSVTTPNGDTISFNYDSYTPDFISDADNALGGQTLVVTSGPDSAGGFDDGEGNSNQGSSTSTSAGVFESYSKIGRTYTYLTQINSSKGYVKFIRDNNKRIDIKGNRKRLQKIEVYNSLNKKIKEVELIHNYFTSTIPGNFYFSNYAYLSGSQADQDALTKRLYLEGVIFKGVNDGSLSGEEFYYEFQYDSSRLPFKWSQAQDHWGYYNGATSNITMIPVAFEQHVKADRDVNPQFTQACMLKSIRYPEGGTTSFSYENNEVDVNNGSQIYQEYSGGLRIRRITNSEGQRKTYSYSKGYQLSKPFYWELQQNGRLVISSVSSVPLLTTQSGYVGYEEVDERISVGNAETYTISREYSKSAPVIFSIMDAPYVGNYAGGLLKKETTPVSETTNEYVSYATYYPTTASGLRSVSGMRIRERYELQTDFNLVDFVLQNNSIDQCIFNNVCPLDRHIYTLNPFQLFPSKSTQQMTRPGEQMTTVTETFYESRENHYYPTRTLTTNSEGRQLETKYFYPFEAKNLSGVDDVMMDSLLNEHQLGIPVEIQRLDNSILVAKNRTNFDVFEGNPLADEVQTAKLTDNLDSRVTYYSYTPYGQPQEVALEDGAHIVYLWDANYNYPIAKIENATLAEVNDALVNSNINTVRQNNTLPNAMITTYSYKPMVGLTSMTDSRGYRMTYEYDDFNRLKRVKDADGHIISENNYHYKGQ